MPWYKTSPFSVKFCSSDPSALFRNAICWPLLKAIDLKPLYMVFGIIGTFLKLSNPIIFNFPFDKFVGNSENAFLFQWKIPSLKIYYLNPVLILKSFHFAPTLKLETDDSLEELSFEQDWLNFRFSSCVLASSCRHSDKSSFISALVVVRPSILVCIPLTVALWMNKTGVL